MSAATLSPGEFVKGLSDTQKEEVLLALVDEVLAVYAGSAFIPLHKPDGSMLAVITTVEEVQRQFDTYGPKLTSEERAELTARAQDPGPTVPFEEALRWLDEEDDEPDEVPARAATDTTPRTAG